MVTVARSRAAKCPSSKTHLCVISASARRNRRLVSPWLIYTPTSAQSLTGEGVTVKKYWNSMVIGGLLGSLLVSWLAPKVIAWYFDPPVNIGVNCRDATEWSMRNLQKAQVTGLLMGALLALSIVYLRQRSAEKKLPA